jgi:hypothetical protein
MGIVKALKVATLEEAIQYVDVYLEVSRSYFTTQSNLKTS